MTNCRQEIINFIDKNDIIDGLMVKNYGEHKLSDRIRNNFYIVMDDFVASPYLHCVTALCDIYREISRS